MEPWARPRVGRSVSDTPRDVHTPSPSWQDCSTLHRVLVDRRSVNRDRLQGRTPWMPPTTVCKLSRPRSLHPSSPQDCTNRAQSLQVGGLVHMQSDSRSLCHWELVWVTLTQLYRPRVRSDRSSAEAIRCGHRKEVRMGQHDWGSLSGPPLERHSFRRAGLPRRVVRPDDIYLYRLGPQRSQMNLLGSIFRT